jgi:hypothetical protein
MIVQLLTRVLRLRQEVERRRAAQRRRQGVGARITYLVGAVGRIGLRVVG